MSGDGIDRTECHYCDHSADQHGLPLSAADATWCEACDCLRFAPKPQEPVSAPPCAPPAPGLVSQAPPDVQEGTQ